MVHQNQLDNLREVRDYFQNLPIGSINQLLGTVRADKVKTDSVPVCVGCHLSILFNKTNPCLDPDTDKYVDYHMFTQWIYDDPCYNGEQTELYRTIGCTIQDLLDAGAGNPEGAGISGLNPFGMEAWRVHPADVFVRLYEQKKAEAEKVPSTP